MAVLHIDHGVKEEEIRAMKVDWSVVTGNHVEYACNLNDTGRCVPKHPAINTFLLHRDKRYPAKFIRGLVYELAVEHKLDPNHDYEGGEQTANFFSNLELEIENHGERYKRS